MSAWYAMHPRKWVSWLFRLGVVVGACCLAWGFVIEPGRLVQRDYTFALPHWSRACQGLRVDLVSDVHTGSPRNGLDNLDRLVGELASSDSDAVLMAGDYVIHEVFLGTYIDAATIAPHLRPLTRRKPVFAVLGNHDWWKNGPQVRRALESAGVVVLEDESRAVRWGGCPLTVVGVGDLWEGRHDIGKAFAGVAAGGPVLALTHNPDLFPRIPATASLVLAGHTHGGQVSLPLVGTPILPSKMQYAIGHVVEHGRQLFVTPGIGTSIVPVRFGVPPEISRLTLNAAPAVVQAPAGAAIDADVAPGTAVPAAPVGVPGL